ncbi:MAG: ribosome biogenesis GTPase Der [Bacteroidota bacterium]
MSNIVAIIGRPNVGKSTFFNRLIQSREAIVDEVSGVTRDRHYGHVDWCGKEFSVIDTGGYIHGSGDVFEGEIRKQVMIAIEEADILVFMVDVITGITDLDLSVADLVRKSGKKSILVANKVDNSARINDSNEFYRLGLGEVFCISSINGSGTGELLDKLTGMFDKEHVDETKGLPKFAIVGQPNVGKSSFLNTLIGEERSIVTAIAGTTRDSINTRYNAFGFDFLLIDTAGLRRKTKVKEDIEFYSVMRAIKSIEEADVCILMIDATQGMTSQDINIFHLADKNKKGIVILVNKWDLIEKETNSTKVYTDLIKAKISPFIDIPIIYVSVHDKQRIHKALETALKVYKGRTEKIPTSKLNKIMLPIIEHTPPPAVKGKNIKIKYITMLPSKTPSFAFFCNMPQYIKEGYRRFLENQLRDKFDLSGVPISIYFRGKDEDED